jgi:hypothetical protein
MIDTRSKTVYVLAKFVYALEVLLGFTAGHEVAAFVSEILGGIAHGRSRSLACPTESGPRESSELVGRYIAQDEREFLFEIRPQQQSELAEFLGKLGIAVDAHVATLQHGFGRLAGERQQTEGPSPNDRVRLHVRVD